MNERMKSLIPSLEGNDIVVFEYMQDNADAKGFDGSMKDIADIMEVPIMDVLKFFNMCFDKQLLVRINASRYNFI